MIRHCSSALLKRAAARLALPKRATGRAWHRRAGRLLWSGVACCLYAAHAFAQSCTPTASTLAFGDVTSQVLANQAADATGTISYTCTGTANDAIRICLALDNFNASNTRTMTGGAGTLDFQIYQDAARTIRWGNQTTGTILTIDATLSASGTLSGSATMYGRVLTGQTAEPPASYLRNMNGGTRQRLTVTTNTGNACGSFNSGQTQFSFNVTATIANQCNVSASALDFGSTVNLTAIVNQSSTIQAQCTNTTPYNIGLNAGTGAGATVATRKMTSGGNTINYSLYRDAARSQVWGTTISTNAVSATGTGSTQNHAVYGRVPVQTTPNPATYSDTINVTVTY